MIEAKKWHLIMVISITLFATLIATTLVVVKSKAQPSFTVKFEYPERWDSNYVEDAKAYEEMFDGTIQTNFYTNQSFDAIPTTSLITVTSATSTVQTANDTTIAMYDEQEAWTYISNGLWNDYPTGSFASNKSKLVQLQQENTETIKVKVWYWANPDDEEDMSKITTYKTFAVNSKLAAAFKHIFEDIYNDPSQPVINIADSGMGTWVLRGKNHNSSNTMSAHALGCAIDINPSTGSFKLNGTWYGNGYKHKAMSKTTWAMLPECHTKYHVLYDGCPIVETFKSYGFYWGGDWKDTPDPMHLSYIGDGPTARSTGISNYNERH